MNELGALVASHIPALVMLIVGYALLVVEMYVPGFGLPGISGIVLLTVGMIAMEPSPLQALVLVLIIVLMLGTAFSVAMHSFSKGRLSKSKLVLSESLDPKAENDDDLDYFVGKTGTTHTARREAQRGVRRRLRRRAATHPRGARGGQPDCRPGNRAGIKSEGIRNDNI